MTKNQHFLPSFRHAFNGIKQAFVNEKNLRIHLAATILVIFVSIWLQITLLQWAVILVVIAMVWVAELFNTSIEAFFDIVHPGESDLVKTGKDSAAGAVLVCAIISVIVGLLVLGPPLYHKLFG